MKKTFTNTLLLAGLSLFLAAANKLNAQNWNGIIKAVASDRAIGHRFGQAVAVNGDYAAIGASATNAAYIFKRTGATWAQEAKIVASDRAVSDNFGESIAIDGDLVVVGAANDDKDATGGNMIDAAGSAYIFKRTGTTWAQEAKTVASVRKAAYTFGCAVGISNGYALVGARGESLDPSTAPSADNTGAAYFFTFDGNLPVELLSFNGKNTEGGNFLTWTTASEVNNKGFDIQRLNGNGEWSILGFVKGNNKASTYQFLDDRRDAMHRVSTTATEYYRLRQMDNDGKETLSKVVSIQSKDKGKLKVYPNPVSNTLTIESPLWGLGAADYQIFNLLGQEILRGQTSLVGVVGLDVSALPKGSYILKMGNEKAQFIKQ